MIWMLDPMYKVFLQPTRSITGSNSIAPMSLPTNTTAQSVPEGE